LQLALPLKRVCCASFHAAQRPLQSGRAVWARPIKSLPGSSPVDPAGTPFIPDVTEEMIDYTLLSRADKQSPADHKSIGRGCIFVR
jgi:hypothetical protein